MTGIFGCVRFDGGSVSPDTLDAMGRAMAHRGCIRRPSLVHGGVGLGQLARAAAPHRSEPLPSGDALDPPIVSVFDGVILNREALLRDLEARELSPVGNRDVDLVTAAYRAWGDDAAARILGDFAFSIWDGRRRQLVLARDPFGVRPLYVHTSDEQVVFASEIRGVLASGSVPRRANEERVADYFVPPLELADCTSTFFLDVHRHPPGHVTRYRDRREERRRYWRLDPERRSAAHGERDAVDRFRETLRSVVRDRIRAADDPKPPASMLTGGVDSGALVCFGREHQERTGGPPIRTLSILSEDETRCPEAGGVRAVLGQGGVESQVVRVRDVDAYAPDLERLLETNEDPFVIHVVDVVHTSYAEARRQGLTSLWSGVDGDLIAGGTYDGILDALRHPDLQAAWRTAAGFARREGSAPIQMLWRHGVRPPLRRARESGLAFPTSILTPDLVARSGVRERLAGFRPDLWAGRPATTAAEHHAAKLSGPRIPVALERYDRAASAHGITAAHPLLDRRLAELAVSLPARWKARGGWPKAMLRRAGRGIVPASVLWRGPSPNLSPPVFLRLMAATLPSSEAVLEEMLPRIDGWLQPAPVRAALSRMRAGPIRYDDADQVVHAVALACWLRHHRVST